MSMNSNVSNVFNNKTCNVDYKCKSDMLFFVFWNVLKNETCN